MQNDPEEYTLIVPRSVTFLFFFVLSMTAWGGIRFWATLVNWEILSRFRANVFYIFATGIIWFILGGILLVLIFKGHPRTLIIGPLLALLYAGWYWFDRLVMQISPAENGIFSIIVTAVLLIIFHIILFWPSSQAFFKETQ
jgi:hypothetical protein